MGKQGLSSTHPCYYNIYHKVRKEQRTWLQGSRNRIGAKQDPVHKNGIKQHNIMFKLPYWEVILVSQNIKFDLNKS